MPDPSQTIPTGDLTASLDHEQPVEQTEPIHDLEPVQHVDEARQFEQIETERLVIRPWTLSDDDLADALVIYGDPDVLRYMGGGSGDASIDETRRRLERYLQASQPRPGFPAGLGLWAIEDKATGRVIGTVELVPLDGGPEIEVGYHLAQHAWGNGYATEAARAILNYGFYHLGLDRIVGVIYPENAASRGVLQNCGMTFVRNGVWFGWNLEQYAVDAATFASSARQN